MAAWAARRVRWASARSSSMSSPSWVGLTEISPVEAARLDGVEHGDVVVGHRVRLGDALEVLAELRVHRPDAGGLQGRGGIERGLHRLARHEPADRPAHEAHPGQVVPEPGVTRGPQEDPAHQGRARTRPPSTWTIAPVT